MQDTHTPITEEVMIALADSMAAAATTFSGQGYDQFILARDVFKSTTHQLFVNGITGGVCLAYTWANGQ